MNNYYIAYLILFAISAIPKLQTQDYSESYIYLIQSQINEVNEDFMNSFGLLWKTNNFTAYFSPYKDSTVNGITYISTASCNNFRESMDQIISYAKLHALPFTWLTNYKASQNYIAEYLTNKGFILETFDVMIYDLHYNKIDHITQEHVRLIQQNEINLWLSIFYEIFEEAEFDINFIQAWEKLMKSTINENNKTVEYYAGYTNNTIVATGTLYTYQTYGYIANIGTKNTYQRQGMATKILKSLISSAQKKGLDHVFLLTNTATQFYQNFGFKKICEISNYTFAS